MEPKTPKIVFKYFDLTDEFLRIRVIDPETAARKLERSLVTNKASYRHLVLEACVVDWTERVSGNLEATCTVDVEAAEELLYQICIEVNPRLEIHQVSLATNGSSRAALPEPAGEADERNSRRSAWLDRLDALERHLLWNVVGQDEAIHKLLRALRKNAVGLSRPGRPVGCYLFLGHTGVGKTALAKHLASGLHEPGRGLVRIDCSEYGLPHEYSKLIGAPPGYIGHGEGGILTDAVSETPDAVVLFDEIEKAHPKVHQLLLQILDEGRLTDSQGCTVSFERTLVLLTSNTGTRQLIEACQSTGFLSAPRALDTPTRHEIAERALRETFAPEFLNRLDDVLLFRDLDGSDLLEISRRNLDRVVKRLAELDVAIEIARSVASWVAEQATEPGYGARPIERFVAHHVEDALAERLVDGSLTSGGTARLSIRKGLLTIQCQGGSSKDP